MHIVELLEKSEMEYNHLKAAAPYSLNTQDMTQQRHSWIETNARNSINDNDNESVGSSPDMIKVLYLGLIILQNSKINSSLFLFIIRNLFPSS